MIDRYSIHFWADEDTFSGVMVFLAKHGLIEHAQQVNPVNEAEDDDHPEDEREEHVTTRQLILSHLRKSSEPLSPRELAKLTGRASGSISATLNKLMKGGDVVRAGRGLYMSKPRRTVKRSKR